MTDDIAALLELDDVELFRLLASSAGAGLGPRDLYRRGREMFSNCVERLHKEVCDSPRVKAIWEKSRSGDTELVAAIADCISAPLAGVSPFIVATLFVKRGLPRICGAIWGADAG